MKNIWLKQILGNVICNYHSGMLKYNACLLVLYMYMYMYFVHWTASIRDTITLASDFVSCEGQLGGFSTSTQWV